MLINDTEAYNRIWDWVDEELGFTPSSSYTGHDPNKYPPFRIKGNYAVYGIEHMNKGQLERMDELILGAFLSVTEEGQRLYALDWQHSAFLFDPRKPEERKSVYLGESPFWSGGVWAAFPDFYPDGDYYFFIAESLEFGYLSHPWRKEVWLFGDRLIAAFEEICPDLGWDKLT